ncbi:FAD/NAD(P)-binding domain-containing protein, partial [Sporormia fimetaria CBS 119925]
MTYSVAWCYLPLALLSLTAHARPIDTPPVCIIGAGPSGLTAASKLEEKGVRAIIFDKQPDLGGKCQSYYDDLGIFHPLGAAFYSNGTYTETLKVLNAAGVPSEEFALSGEREQFQFNYTAANGDIEPVPDLNLTYVAQLSGEIPRYIQLWQRVFAPLSVPGYTKGVPDELSVPGIEWFRANNFSALPELLINPLALYGYGDINIVPALYILEYITPDILTGFVGAHQVYYTDFQKVFKQWSKKALCKTPIKLATEIRCIDRSGAYPVLKYTAPSTSSDFYTWETQECSALIMAFPPTIENLERAGLDLHEEEFNVFDNVITHNYFSSAVELALPFGVSYIHRARDVYVPPPNDNEPVAVLRLDERSNVSTAWSWGPDDIFVDEKPVRDLLLTTMSKLNKDPRDMQAMAEPLCDADIRAFRKWDYFPHFGSQALKQDIYKRLDELQGCRKTYWASGLQGMETVEWAIRAGKDVVERLF